MKQDLARLNNYDGTDVAKVCIIGDDVGPSDGAVACENGDGHITDGRIDYRHGPCALSAMVDAAAAADVESSTAALNLNLVPVKTPVLRHLNGGDAVAESERGGRILLRSDAPADGAALKLEIGNEAAGAIFGEDANVVRRCIR